MKWPLNFGSYSIPDRLLIESNPKSFYHRKVAKTLKYYVAIIEIFASWRLSGKLKKIIFQS